jgi:hypothetical protein
MNWFGIIITVVAVVYSFWDVSQRILNPWYYETEYYRVVAVI